MRISCFYIPLFPLAARLRSEPELQGTSLVIVEGSGTGARVFTASRRARKQGVRAGITLAQARAILPGLVARARDPECERAAQEALLDVAESLSPRVEDAGEGVAFVDLEGLERMYGMQSAFCTQFSQHALSILDRAALPARVGIASSKLAARVAAELPETPTIVPEGEEETFLAPLPLGRLAVEMEIAERLARWGLRSIGDFARLPEREVASRLGEAGRALHSAARGVDLRPLIPRVPPPDFREGMDLEWPLIALEPFLFVANAALDRLTKRLAARGLSCRRLEIELRLEPDGWHVRAIELPAPTRDVKTLLTLTRLDLEAHPPGAPVAGFVFVAHPDQPRTAQLSLYGPLALSPDRLATTIARLAALVGSDRVGTPYPVDSHIPERFTIADYAPPSPPKVRLESQHNRGLLAVRVLRPAVELEVEVEAEDRGSRGEGRGTRNATVSSREASGASDKRPPEANGRVVHTGDPSLTLGMTSDTAPRASTNAIRPSSLTPRSSILYIRALYPDGTLKIDGRVRIASGPWAMEEGWWSDAPVEREYWDVELERGGIYRIYRDRDGRWFADGVYD